jgi:hypothetical protein
MMTVQEQTWWVIVDRQYGPSVWVGPFGCKHAAAAEEASGESIDILVQEDCIDLCHAPHYRRSTSRGRGDHSTSLRGSTEPPHLVAAPP